MQNYVKLRKIMPKIAHNFAKFCFRFIKIMHLVTGLRPCRAPSIPWGGLPQPSVKHLHKHRNALVQNSIRSRVCNIATSPGCSELQLDNKRNFPPFGQSSLGSQSIPTRKLKIGKTKAIDSNGKFYGKYNYGYLIK